MIFPFAEQQIVSTMITRDPETKSSSFPFGPESRGAISGVLNGTRFVPVGGPNDPNRTFKQVPLSFTDISKMSISISDAAGHTLVKGHQKLFLDFVPPPEAGETPPNL